MKKGMSFVLVVALGLSLAMGCWASTEKQTGKPPAKESIAKIKDPVCGMEIDAAKSKENTTYNGKIYRFCSSHCKAEFVKNPAKYAK